VEVGNTELPDPAARLPIKVRVRIRIRVRVGVRVTHPPHVMILEITIHKLRNALRELLHGPPNRLWVRVRFLSASSSDYTCLRL